MKGRFRRGVDAVFAGQSFGCVASAAIMLTLFVLVALAGWVARDLNSGQQAAGAFLLIAVGYISHRWSRP